MKAYTLRNSQALIIGLLVTVGTYLSGLLLMRSGDVGLLALSGVLWPILVPFGWLGPAIVLTVFFAEIVRQKNMAWWWAYVFSLGASIGWFIVAGILIDVINNQGRDIVGYLLTSLHPITLLLILLLVVVTLAFDRWIHTPKKS